MVVLAQSNKMLLLRPVILLNANAENLGSQEWFASFADTFSKAKSASSLPAKLGSGIWKILFQSGISRAIHSAIVSFANAVKPEAFCELAATIVEPPINGVSSNTQE